MKDAELALRYQPLLELDPKEPDHIIDVFYKVKRYGDKTSILYVYSWDRQDSPFLGWLLNHAFDYEPIVVTLDKKGEVIKVAYDRSHYRVGVTDKPYLRVVRGFHNYKPLKEKPEKPWKARDMKPLSPEMLKGMDADLKGVKRFFGLFKPLSLLGAYIDPAAYGKGDSFSTPEEREDKQSDDKCVNKKKDDKRKNKKPTNL